MLGREEDDAHEKDVSVLEDGINGCVEDEPAEMVLLQEVQDLKWENKKIRVAGIVKCVDLVEQEMTIFYEYKNLRVNLRNLRNSTIQTIEEGSRIEVVGNLVNQVDSNSSSVDENKTGRSLIVIAQMIRYIQGIDLYFYQLSIILRRKVLTSVNIIC